MEMTDKKGGLFADYAALAADSGALRCITFSSPRNRSSDISKVRGEMRLLGGERVLQLEYSMSEGRLRHENIQALKESVKDAVTRLLDAGFTRAELYAGEERASLLISKKGKETLTCSTGFGEAVLKSASDGGALRGNNRKKSYIIPEDAPFLYILGISDKNGRVHDKKRAKFRQINRFSEYAADYLKKFPGDGEVRIADLCCGKSYLSFALYHTATAVLGRRCRMICVDLKKSVIDEVSAAAEASGFDGMEFVCGDISKFSVAERPHMVVSLHACDTATDMALDFAIKSGAETILATPCCHRELSQLLDCPELGFIAENSVLRQKFCSAATDSLRLLKLRAAGYKADAVEFVDPEDTPKNVMLRANYTGKKTDDLFERYENSYRFLTGKNPPPIPLKLL